MARKSARGGSSAILMVLWIVFAILFIFSAVLAGLFYSQVNKAKEDAANATKALNKFANTSERSSADVAERQSKGGGSTVVGSLQAENTEFKGIISGVKEIAASNVTTSVESMRGELARLETDEKFKGNPRLLPGTSAEPLLQIIEKLQLQNVSDFQTIESQKSAVETASKRATEAEQSKTQLTQNYDKSLAELRGQLATLTAQAKEYQNTVETQRKTLEDQLAAARAQAAQMAADKDGEISKREATIKDLQGRIAARPGGAGSVNRPPPVDPASLPDGKIISVLSEERLAYIDLGKADHLQPGMTFEVFDRTGVTQNEFKEWRGKGTIEIVTINENSSVARIVRVARNKSITEGDLIANAVYDKNMKYKFVVFGDFDIDNIGQATTADRRRIESMISEWGGTLRPQLTYDVDFLVLGPEPRLPDPLPKGTPDPEVIAKHTAQKVKYDAYQSLLVTAKELSIPVLNQNRFLALVGYYKR